MKLRHWPIGCFSGSPEVHACHALLSCPSGQPVRLMVNTRKQIIACLEMSLIEAERLLADLTAVLAKAHRMFPPTPILKTGKEDEA